MPDPYANIAEVDSEIQERLASALEIRAADPRQRAMLEEYLSRVEFPRNARVLDLGCGTGAITRVLAELPGVGEVIGVDPSAIFLEKARELASGLANVSFHQGDARSLDFEDSAFDVVVIHTCLCHVPGPERVLEEAFRVLRYGGWLSAFDGDYATTTVATGEFDPLQTCADAAIAALVHDRWLVRRFPALVESAGFHVDHFDGHAYVQTLEPDYALTLVSRGADALVAAGRVGSPLAEAFKAEARRRVEEGIFYASISFASVIGRKPN